MIKRTRLIPGKDCIPFTRLIDGIMKGTLTATEKQHMDDCKICKRTVANVHIAQLYTVDMEGNLRRKDGPTPGS